MVTPKKSEIEAKALAIHAERNHHLDYITPEKTELTEDGTFIEARNSLMRNQERSQVLSYLEETANQEGYQLVRSKGDVLSIQPFNVDLQELFESNGLILGSRHTGKSDLAMLVCDRAEEEKAIVVVFDPSLDWIARSSISQYIKVEPYTVLTVPSENTIFDISLSSPSEQQRTVEKFSRLLFEHQARTPRDLRKQYLVIFEEAHAYFYQGCLRAKASRNSVRLLSVGRNVDIACVLVSQFAAMLDKFAIKHALSQAWFGFAREPNDLRYLRQILGEETEYVTKLSDGEFLYLSRKGVAKTYIHPYITQNKPKKVEISQSLPEPQPLASRHQDTGKAVTSLLIALLWFIAIILALWWRP